MFIEQHWLCSGGAAGINAALRSCSFLIAAVHDRNDRRHHSSTAARVAGAGGAAACRRAAGDGDAVGGGCDARGRAEACRAEKRAPAGGAAAAALRCGGAAVPAADDPGQPAPALAQPAHPHPRAAGGSKQSASTSGDVETPVDCLHPAQIFPRPPCQFAAVGVQKMQRHPM